ncbi:DUF885 domain-containing protein [Flaviaesturariibacter amylovorans]|uniref:DUF885 family protein n=1 Tax=Flaviaesturariibacter amylovorans TaxID=1084520 RepID=A0ABP8H7N1_9BACT
MRRFLMFICLLLAESLCAQPDSKALRALFDTYQEEENRLNPLGATFNGDYRYNDQLPVTFTDSYAAKWEALLQHYLGALSGIRRERLNEQDRLSYDVFEWNTKAALEGLRFKSSRIPLTHFTGMHLTLAQAGGGDGFQPFKTVRDYEQWARRAAGFAVWADSAIRYMRLGMAEGIVLPRALVLKMIPQLEGFVVNDAAESVYFKPVRNFAEDVPEAERARLRELYTALVREHLVPAYRRLATFVKDEYLPAARIADGWGSLPGGATWYAFLVRQSTTGTLTPEAIHQLGLSEVARIRGEMERMKDVAGFNGSLNDYVAFLRAGPGGGGYRTVAEFLAGYKAIEARIAPRLKNLFVTVPKTPLEVRAVEAARAATSPAHYVAGLADGSRAGIFYVPVVDATRARVRESLFLHEGVPGHHYQIMLQRENERLPAFRRLGGFTAFAEGWGLYAESLGKDLGLYTDDYQAMSALLDELYRAARLVVDPGIHAKGWTREQGIRYLQEEALLGERTAMLEVERYMAIPGQALGYKVGSLKLQELRDRYRRQLGAAFDLAQFHHQVLKDGALPLDLLEGKLDAWARSVGGQGR